MAASVGRLHTAFPDIAGHLLAASIMAAPATVLVSELLVPETEETETGPDSTIDVPKLHENVIDAAAAGASEGLMLALNVGWTLGLFGFEGVTLQKMLGYAFTPVAPMPFQDALDAAAERTRDRTRNVWTGEAAGRGRTGAPEWPKTTRFWASTGRDQPVMLGPGAAPDGPALPGRRM